MRRILFVILSFFLFWAADAGFAREEERPKFDAAFQVSFLNLNRSPGEYPVGIGGRFGYRLPSLLYLDGEALHFPENPSGNFGETLVLGVIRSGMEFYSTGIFGKSRAGIIHPGGRQFHSRMDVFTHPAIDLRGNHRIFPQSPFLFARRHQRRHHSLRRNFISGLRWAEAS